MDDKKKEVKNISTHTNEQGYLKQEFAAGPQALDQILTLLGFDETHATQRVIIDIKADGLVRITTQEIVDQDKWDGVLAVMMGEDPVMPDPKELNSDNTSNRRNKLMVTRQQKQQKQPLQSKAQQVKNMKMKLKNK